MRPLFREILQIVLLAVVVFFVLHFLIQNFRIEGSSMEPNLHSGQYVLVNKTAYWFGHDPSRGDVIVFHAPDQPRADRIKRVIGLPGETVEVRKDGTVYITRPGETTSTLLDEPYVVEPGGISGEWSVPEGHYFVMGDNRAVSHDSRTETEEGAPVPRGNIIGKAWIIIWPIGNWGFAPNRSPVLEAAP